MSINYSKLTGQHLVMTGTLGVRTDTKSNANGFIQKISLQRYVSKKLAIGLNIGHAFTESRSEIFEENSPKAYIRHVNQPVPEGVINNLWKESSFPGIDIPDKGNRYDDLFVSLSVNYLAFKSNKNNIHAGIGMGIHKKDHSEQINAIYTSEVFWVIGGHRTADIIIPIYSYNTFLDFSTIPSVTYEYKLRQNLGFTFESVAFVYPVSKTCSLGQSLGFMLRF